MARFAADHPEYVTGGTDGPWRMALPLGQFEVRQDAGALLVDAQGVNPIGLSYMKLIFVDHIREYLDAPVELVWEGDGQGQGLPPFFREARVTAVRRVTPALQRVTFAVPDLAALPVDELHIRLLLPPPGRPANLPPVWPMLTPSGSLTFPGGADALLVRIYTIRRVDVARGEVDIDFVLHPTEGASAASWAASCKPGDIVGLLGPGGGPIPRTPRLLLLGDETALPAIARILESLPDTTICETIIEVNGPEDQQVLARPVTWLHRRGAAPGTTRLLAEALTRCQPSEDLYLWAACEFDAFRDIRRHVRSVWKMPRDRHMVVAYWRRGIAGELAEEPHHTSSAA
ncbi:siderophore-interacting protein [Plastorhodobacter daqingensis]|uniref:Siderophore-interacting protein n=1 Tax=Plastorhodobacter daqingensis TaxID=1387281 RepID=A0ABW2UIM2_9RHOB